MKAAASALFGLPDSLPARPNTFGELMRAIVSPSRTVHEAVTWALKGVDPDIALHMRMMSSRYARTLPNCPIASFTYQEEQCDNILIMIV
jgi:hypothetical protein